MTRDYPRSTAITLLLRLQPSAGDDEGFAACAKIRPVVIQSLFMKVHGVAPSDAEIGAYCARLRETGSIKLVQIYTIARKPMT